MRSTPTSSSRRWIRAGAALAVTLAAGTAVLAHVRLNTGPGGNDFFWSNPGNVGIVINSTGSDNIADESETAAVRLAIEEWNAVSGTTFQLVEDDSDASRTRTDWQETDIHLVLFDENDSSGYFPGNSGTVAVTPLLFQGNGRIVDADILFNGDDWQFTTTAQGGAFDVQDVVTHELGHLAGLDHSGWAGSTMYPFVDPSIIEHRSVSLDEVRGMRDAYAAQSFGRINGRVERASDASAVVGAHVVARDADGRTSAGTLTDAGGDYVLRGLDPGTYTVYAVPLDDPVSSSNLGDGSSFTIETDFEPALYGNTATITGTQNIGLGTLVVDGDTALNVGESSDLFPVPATVGSVNGPIFLSGSGLEPGSTLALSDPDLTLGSVIFSQGSVSFTVTVPPGEPLGHVDLTVTDTSGDMSILPSAIEIVSPAPTVTDVSPVAGSANGGSFVTLTGTGFRAGANVVIGDQVYTDGLDATVVDATTITLTTKPTFAATHDVVVFDSSGVEGRFASGFRTGAIPAIQVLFPAAGAAAGGTQVTVTGNDFVAGLVVRIDGTPQTVDSVSATEVVFTTLAHGGATGIPLTLEIENPDLEVTTSQFTFEGQADPVLVAVDPATGTTKGGDTITVTGSDFTSDSEVLFGVDPTTGAGGTSAALVSFVDATTLTVTTPAMPKGPVAMMVRDMSTGQASLLAAAFTFQSSGGGGGGCYMVPLTPPSGSGSELTPLLGAWWMLALFAVLTLRGRRASRSPATTR